MRLRLVSDALCKRKKNVALATLAKINTDSTLNQLQLSLSPEEVTRRPLRVRSIHGIQANRGEYLILRVREKKRKD